MTTCTNPNCGYEWKPRAENPVSCPKCRQYLKRTITVKHLPSDYPPSDEALMDAQAEAEAKHGEERVSADEN